MVKIVCCCPQNDRFWWETYTFLHNMTENGHKNVLILVFQGATDEMNEKWLKIQVDFPHVEFFFWKDNENFLRLAVDVFGYIPLIRPKLLLEYWKLHPEMEKEIFFYTDTDVLFKQPFNFDKFIGDDVIYMSDAASYTNGTYFDSKLQLNAEGGPKFVQPNKFEEFKSRDFLEELGNICGITRKQIEENNNTSGAAQYLLKNIDTQYWQDVLNTCITLKIHINNANAQYMQGSNEQEKQNNGWQAWCVDIWAVNWLLIKRGRTISTPKEFDFAWSTDDISSLENKIIYHNAGITSNQKIKRKVDKTEVDCPVFWKGMYTDQYKTPFEDVPTLMEVISHPISSKFCVAWYCEQLIETKTKYNL